MTANEADPRIKRYFHDAAELRACVQRNMDDFSFSSDGGTIVYLVDANVVRLFCNPAGEQRHIRIFTGEGFHPSLSGTAIVTAEFLFSRGLAGQGNQPCYISDPHFEELESFVGQLVRPQPSIATRTSPEARFGKREFKRLERIRVLADAISVGQTKAALEISQLLGDLVNIPLVRSVTEAAQWRRLLVGDRLRPLRLHEAATESVLSVTDKESKPWTDRILMHDKARREAGKTGKPKGHDQARRDATTLVQIERLNDVLDGYGDPNFPIRCVLVTTDIVLYEAYALWFWREGNSSQNPGRFFLRLPTQYIPLLNVAEMPNGIGFSDLVPRTRVALDSLLASIAKADAPHYPHSLPFHAATEQLNQKGPFRDLLDKLYGTTLYSISGNDAMFESLQSSWNAAFLDSVTLNWELVQRFLSKTFGTVLKDLPVGHDDAVEATLLNFQRTLLEKVEQAHTQFMTTLNIAEMAQNHSARSLGPGRGPLAVRVTFDLLTGGQDVVSYLDSAFRSSNKAYLKNLYHNLRSLPFGYDFLFFSACVAFRCGQWALAKHYAARALEVSLAQHSGQYDPVAFEIEHLIAVTDRFQLIDNTDYGAPRELLLRAVEHFKAIRDPFGVMRAYSELAALSMVVILQKKLASQSDVLDHKTFLHHMHEARSSIAESTQIALMHDDLKPAPIRDVVKVQVFTNVVCYEILRRHGLSCDDSEATAEGLDNTIVSQSVHYLSQRIHEYPSVLLLEYLFLNGELGPGDVRAEFDRQFKEEVRKYRADPRPSARTELDSVTIEWLAEKVEGRTLARRYSHPASI